MTQDPALVERYRAELAAYLANEEASWRSFSQEHILQRLSNGPYVYEANFNGVRYNLVADLLENTDSYIHVLLDAQPEPNRAGVIASPRIPSSGGWTNDELGSDSISFILRK